MSTWIKGSDPILNMDIEKLAETVSGFTRTSASAQGIAQDVSDAIYQGCLQRDEESSFSDDSDEKSGSGGCVSTLIVPHDFAFQANVCSYLDVANPPRVLLDGAEEFIRACASALQDQGKKKAIYVGGAATLSDNDNFAKVGKIAAACGAKLYCESLFSRLDRGVGYPHASRLPYFPQDAVREFSKFDMVLCIDARNPIAMFGYEKGPTELISLSEDHLWEIDTSFDIESTLQMLFHETKANRIKPGTNCGGLFIAKEARPRVPREGKLTAMAMCNLIALHQPKNAIVVDESITSGTNYYEASKGCPSFSHLYQTGGAIGIGPPLSVGAAIACPSRKVINIQADGSGLYSPQALWSQAKESLDVVTVVCSNRKYNILNIELDKQRVSSSTHGENLTDLSTPPINWVSLGEGFGVKASRASTVGEFETLFAKAVQTKGPHLIEAIL
jgi:acetolactate synthase-1/2/3 large subunit